MGAPEVVGLLIILVFTVAWVWLGAWIAQSRGRLQVLGGLLHLLLGFIGTLLLFLIPKNEDELYRRQLEREERMTRLRDEYGRRDQR